MATRSYVGIDVSKDWLEVGLLGEERGWQGDHTQAAIANVVQQMQERCPEHIVASSGVEALFRAKWIAKR